MSSFRCRLSRPAKRATASRSCSRLPISIRRCRGPSCGCNHRILVKGQGSEPPAWVPYDPGALKELLARCRSELLGVFMRREETGIATTTPGLNATNGKSKRQFQLDVYVLAQLGSQLR